MLECEDRGRQDDQIGGGRRGGEIPNHLGRDPQGLGLTTRGGAMAVADYLDAGHALTHSQRDRAAEESQPYDGNLPYCTGDA